MDKECSGNLKICAGQTDQTYVAMVKDKKERFFLQMVPLLPK